MRSSRRRCAALFSCLAVVVALVAACSSVTGPGTSYEQIMTPANAAWATFVTQARTWPNGEIPASGAALAQNVVRAWRQANQELLARQWPGSARGDIAALVRSDTETYEMLERLPAAGAVEAWWTSLTADFSAEQAAAARVRRDLQLPALPD